MGRWALGGAVPGASKRLTSLRRPPQRISWYKFKPMWQTKEAVAERLGQGGG